MRSHTVVESPCGPLTLAAEDGALVGLWMEDGRHAPRPEEFGEYAGPPAGAPDPLPEAARQLAEYFAGDRRDFDLPLAPQGTEFQKSVWAALREIPYGETWSYGRLAEHLGRPGASRAVGLANGRNPISIIVPCHRVIGADGSLTGYGGGLPRKRTLLALEHALPAGPAGDPGQSQLAFPV
ncbi:methylated-DNA--[protein]-cysteine S-methyltransferase [Phaeacidiphilus oryzae]|uniref:methylated-DNA--[protein]-cysteine S-methyltransferase n=1 Tax=Phaeacidiphilus oryzae TaxID=348818 RepID=UPI00056BC929|nr:methylated-DNA--[protein]-cysteine S-methyltransferase [Phaeacidiphilus oryzae]